MFAASPSCALSKMLTAALCEPESMFWYSAITSWIKKDKSRWLRTTSGGKTLSWIEKMTRKMPEAPSVKQLRSFGLVVGGAFWFIGVSPLLHRHDIRGWAIALGVAFVIPALALPMALRYPYRLWMLGGYGLGWINTRVILMLLF